MSEATEVILAKGSVRVRVAHVVNDEKPSARIEYLGYRKCKIDRRAIATATTYDVKLYSLMLASGAACCLYSDILPHLMI